MSYKNLFERTSREALIKLTSDKILQGIEKVEENQDISARRWLWELMQNARDVPNKWGAVSIKLILSKESIKICHNGNPFSIQNLTNLIQQVSSKIEDDENDFVGKFGTGFMVTHLLSKVIKLKGVLQEKGLSPYRFDIVIDRDASNSTDLSRKIQDLISDVADVENNPNFQKIDEFNISENDFETIFEFPLDEKTLVFAKEGIKDMINTLPLTQIFVKKINKLIVVDEIRNEEYDYKKIFHSETNVYEIVGKNASQYFWLKSKNNVDVAVKVTSSTNLTPLKWSDTTPRLYRDFPLIGSEKFNCPFVINSHDFYPDETRSNLLLVNYSNTKVASNRALFTSAFDLAKDFVVSLNSQNVCSNNYLFAELSSSFFSNANVKEWFNKEIKIPYRTFLLDNLRVVAADSSLKLLKEIKFPIIEPITDFPQDQFYTLCSKFFESSSLPLSDSLKKWISAINLDYDSWKTDLKLTLDDLLLKIKSKSTYSEIVLPNNKEIVEAFNYLFSFLTQNGKSNIIQNYEIIPNSFGELKSLKKMSINKRIQNSFLEIIELDQPQYRSFLIHKNINICINHTNVSSKDVLDEINEIVKESDFGNDENDIEIIYQLLRLQFNDIIIFRSKILEAFCLLFNREFQFNLIEREDDKFNFDVVTRKATHLILKKIEDLKNLDSLAILLEKGYGEVVIWLNRLVDIIAENSLVSEAVFSGNIFPNFYGHFSSYQIIYNIGEKDQPVPLELIDLHESILPHADLKAKLLFPKFNYSMGKAKSIAEISNDLDEKARQTYTEWDSSTNNQKNSIFDLLEWTSQDKINHTICENHFNWLKQFKPHILMLKFEDYKTRDAMFSILKSDEEKIMAVSKIIEGSSIEEINKIASVMSDFTIDELEEYKNFRNDIEEVGVGDVKKYIEEKKEEKRDFKFKKQIGNSFEDLFKEYIGRQNLDFELKKMEAPADFKIVNKDKSFYVELKSYSSNSLDKKIRMSFKQAKGAKDFKENYALCILKRPENWSVDSKTNFGYEYMIENVKTVLNIGERIDEGFTKSLEFKTSLLDSDIHGVGIEFKDNDFKITLQPAVWNTDDNLQALIDLIVLKLS